MKSLTLALFILSCPLLSLAQKGPIGYGAETTGADQIKENLCYVTNLEDDGSGSLRECLERSPVWVKFKVSGTINLKKQLSPQNNTTIDGKGSDVLINGKKMTLIDVRQSNIIINDLKFKILQDPNDVCANPEEATNILGCGVAVSIKGNVSKIWVHHNNFSECGEKCIVSGYDKKDQVPTNISISHNNFFDSHYAILVEAVPTMDSGVKYSYVSIYNNHFKNVIRRSPRLSGYVIGHVFNNYIQNWGPEDLRNCNGTKFSEFAFAASSVGEAQLYLERNVFSPSKNSDCTAAVNIEDYVSPKTTPQALGDGYVFIKDNLLLKKASIKDSNPSKVTAPSYDYRLLTTDDVVAKVRSEAGPRN